jgi:arylformamidase
MWLDVSMPLENGMVSWPGDPIIDIRRIAVIEDGSEANLTTLSMCVHTGTHIDAPMHFRQIGASIDVMPLEATVGPARVIEVRDPVAIHESELALYGITSGERVLFRTRNSEGLSRERRFRDDFVYLAADGARYLAARGILAVGIDYLSIGGGPDLGETHRVLANSGAWVIEGLDLSAIAPGDYEMICLPLRLRGAEGAPARAFLRAV